MNSPFSNVDWNVHIIVGSILLFFLIVMVLLTASTHTTNEQILRCYETNKHRTAAEAKVLCVK